MRGVSEEIRQRAPAGRVLLAPRYGGYPHIDDGVEAHQVFHKLRSARSEKFNSQSKVMSDAQAGIPTKGLAAARHFFLGAIVI